MTKAKTIQQQQQLVSKHIPKQKHLTIDLNMIHNPNPAIADAYQKSGAMDQYMDFNNMSEFINEKRIFAFSKGNKRNPEGQPIKHKIISLYRVRKDNTEYCFMHNWMKTNDLMGSPHDWTRILGRYQIPVFSTEYSMTVSESDPSQVTDGAAGGTSIERVETIYQYPWEQIKPQLIEWAKQGIIDKESCNFTLIFGTKKYTVENFDSFINLRIEDLVLLNRTSIDSTGLGLGNKEILAMAREKAKEKLTKSVGEEVRGVRR